MVGGRSSSLRLPRRPPRVESRWPAVPAQRGRQNPHSRGDGNRTTLNIVNTLEPGQIVARHAVSPLAAATRDFRVVVLNGARQSGKTTMLRELQRSEGGVFVTFDDAAVLAAARADPVGFVDLDDRALHRRPLHRPAAANTGGRGDPVTVRLPGPSLCWGLPRGAPPLDRPGPVVMARQLRPHGRATRRRRGIPSPLPRRDATAVALPRSHDRPGAERCAPRRTDRASRRHRPPLSAHP